MGPVVDAHAPPLGGPLLQEIDAHPVSAPDDMGGINAKAAQGVDRRLADGVAGQLGNIDGIQPVVGQRDGYIGLPAAEGGLQLVVLEEPIISIGGQTEHDLAKSYNALVHGTSLLISAPGG